MEFLVYLSLINKIFIVTPKFDGADKFDKSVTIVKCIRRRMWLAIALLGLVAPVAAQSLDSVFVPPAGYQRRPVAAGSFAAYLRQLPIAADTTPVRRFDGRAANWPGCLVVDLPFLFCADLEQCADMALRLYSEYQWRNGNAQELRFTLQNGQPMNWADWCAGKRRRYESALDRHVVSKTSADSSRGSFEQFLAYLFAWSGSVAVKRDLAAVIEADLNAGDLIVQNNTGAMGHVSVILDVAYDSIGNRLFLIGNGWTPAQNFFIRKPGEDEGSGWWFSLEGYEHHLAPFRFGAFHYRRF